MRPPSADPGGDMTVGAPPPKTRKRCPGSIDLDRNVEGQNHEGIVELVVRSNNSETSLNEAVALELLEQAGLASQEATAVQLQRQRRRDRPPPGHENPDDIWMADELRHRRALYKAESTGDYSYRGTIPTPTTRSSTRRPGRPTPI